MIMVPQLLSDIGSIRIRDLRANPVRFDDLGSSFTPDITLKCEYISDKEVLL